MKTILVTGAAGFLGSFLVEHHLNQGDVVYGVDNFSSSQVDSQHHKKLLQRKNYHFKQSDISSQEFLNQYSGFLFDKIYNFACPASPPRYQQIPIETMLTCTFGVHNVLSLADEHTIVVHASTSEIYGDPTVTPQTENYRGNVNSYGPRSCYDEGKRAAEALCYDHMHQRKIDIRLARIFNTYGPRMDPYDGRVVTNFVHQTLKGLPLTMYGDGSQTRSFCYVSDLIKGIVALGTLDSNPMTPINLGNPIEFTMLDLALLIQRKLNANNSIEFKPLPIDDPLQRKPDITLATNLLEWYPVVHLDEGLDYMIEYLRNFDA